MSDVSGFQRRRRIVAAQEDNAAANERINELNDVDELGNGEGNPTNEDNANADFVTDTNMDATVLTDAREENEENSVENQNADAEKVDAEVNEFDDLTLEELRAELDKREVKYAHNAGEDNLRGKLKNAVSGA